MVSGSGIAKLVATLPDGSKVSQSAGIAADGTWPFFGLPHQENGFIGGWITFDPVDGESDARGTLDWVKPVVSPDTYYQQGFTRQCEALLSQYVSEKNVPVLQFPAGENNSRFTVYEGDLSKLPLPRVLSLNAKGKVTSSAGDKFKMTLSLKSGLFSGSFPDPQSGNLRKFEGVVFQQQNRGVGYYEGNADTGGIVFEAAR
ncbi:MAG: hypothetical protein QOE70_5853 [Chthoniobacter sp.]|nr:hypothetical protein [Chthoniobacter sp.]